jgi:hypothetical protein
MRPGACRAPRFVRVPLPGSVMTARPLSEIKLDLDSLLPAPLGDVPTILQTGALLLEAKNHLVLLSQKAAGAGFCESFKEAIPTEA